MYESLGTENQRLTSTGIEKSYGIYLSESKSEETYEHEMV